MTKCMVCHKPMEEGWLPPHPFALPVHEGICQRIAHLSIRLATWIPDEERHAAIAELEQLYAQVEVMTGRVMVEKLEEAAEFLEYIHPMVPVRRTVVSETRTVTQRSANGIASDIRSVIAALKEE